MPYFREVVETVGLVIAAAAVLVIVLGLLLAAYRATSAGKGEAYRQARQDIGRGILLGLEFLVAADIIRTVAITPTMQGVLILGLIVFIRTFLSMALQVELEGDCRGGRRRRTKPRAITRRGERFALYCQCPASMSVFRLRFATLRTKGVT